MSQSVGQLHIEVQVQLAQMQAQFDDMAKRTRALHNKVYSEFGSMTRGIKSVLAPLATILAPTALISFGKSVIDMAGNINDLALAAGIGTQAFQTLSIHFLDSGVKGEELSKALIKLRKSTQEAIEGNKELAKAFGMLGISPVKLQAMSLEKQLETLALAMERAVDKNAAFNATMDILGSKLSPKLLQGLRDLGVEGFDKLTEKTAKWRLSDEQLKTLDDAGDKLARIWEYTKLISAKGLLMASDAAQAFGSAKGPQFGAGAWKTGRPVDVPGTDPKEQATRQAAAAKLADEEKKLRAKQAEMLQAASGPAPLSDEQKAAMKKQQDEIVKRLQEIAEWRERASTQSREANERTAKELETLAEQYREVGNAALQYDKKIAEVMKLRSKNLLNDKETQAAIEELERQKQEAIDASPAAKQAAELQKVADKYKEMIDPAREYRLAIEEVNKALEAGKLTPVEAGQAIKILEDKMKNAVGPGREFARQMEHVFSQIADNAAQAFATMVMEGENAFGSLVKMAAKAALEIIARMAVINPLMNAIFGGMPGFTTLPTFFGGRASGGQVLRGTPYEVGEKGVETFVPETNGVILPHDKLRSFDSSSRGDTFNIDARGADQAGFQTLVKLIADLNGSINRRAALAVVDASQRSLQYRRNLP